MNGTRAGRVRGDATSLAARTFAALCLAAALGLVAGLALLGGCASAGDTAEPGPPDGWGPAEQWVKPAPARTPDPDRFVEGVDHPYWPLVPGARWEYEAETPDGVERIEVVVLEETRTVAGVECVVVRDTVTLDGQLAEDTYDWYAQDTDGNVWYMGEDSREYENGRVVSTAGSWEAGVDGALPGIKVWAEPEIGKDPYYQEYYKGEAEDLGRDLSVDGTATVPAGAYRDVLVVEEWNALAPETVERKYYARGVGVVKEEVTRGGDEVVELVRFMTP